MSVQALSWAFDQTLVKNSTARHVLLCLANYADQDGKAAFPSASTISRMTGLSERTVRYKLDDLEKIGVIEKGNQKIVAAYIDRGDRRPICYNLMISRGAPDAGRGQRGAPHNRTGCTSQQNGVHLTTERGAGAAPKPSVKPLIKPSVKPYSATDADETEKDGQKNSGQNRRTKISESFAPTHGHRTLGEKHGVDVYHELPNFIDHHKSKGSTMVDWNAAFNTWIRNAAKFSRPNRGAKNQNNQQVDYSKVDYSVGIDDDGRF